MNGVGIEKIAAHEHELLEYATEAVGAIPGVRLIGTAREKAGVLSFVMDGRASARHRDDSGSSRASRCAQGTTARSR